MNDILPRHAVGLSNKAEKAIKEGGEVVANRGREDRYQMNGEKKTFGKNILNAMRHKYKHIIRETKNHIMNAGCHKSAH